jgi:TfoX N-terminal domain
LVPDEQLLNRTRAILAGRADVAEKRMVGGRSFIVSGRMACGVSGDALMVRVSVGDRGAVLKEPHVRPMTLGGRELAAYVLVDPAGCATESQLRAWIERGIAA